MKRVLLGILLAVLCICANANSDFSGVIIGKVIDSKSKEDLEFVNVLVKKKGSEELLKGTITNYDGSFTVDNLQEGEYTLVISYMGYQPYEQTLSLTSASKTVNLRTISLKEDSQIIGEIEVIGQKSQMRFEIDKKVFNVDQNIASTGGSASDVLSNIPSVEVDNEGEVSLRGSSNVTIWINGKASGLSEDNRAQILEQMPAESIEKIEVITNPSAKYSPEGTAGIINIVLKQDRKAGYYGSVQAGVDSRGGYNASANINYSSGKVEAYGTLGYRERKRRGGNETTRLSISETDTTYLKQNTKDTGDGGNIFARMGMTYHPTQKDHLSIGAFGMFGSRTGNSRINYESNDPGSFITSQRITNSDNDMNGGNIELGYKHDFSKTNYLDFTASYNMWGMKHDGLYTQHSLYEGGRESTSFQRQTNDINNKNWEFQLDYVNIFDDRNKLEAGYKGTLGREKSPVETFSKQLANDPWSEQIDLFNKFIYNKDIHAIYATYSGRISKLGYQLGLRGEYTKIDTESLTHEMSQNASERYKTDYFDLFPSVFLSYALPNNNEVQVNYTRRISRPWGGQLNSFVNITDSTSISYGNPYLSPQYSNAFELNYIKSWEDHMLSFSGYYRTTDNVIQRIRFLDGNVMKTTSENISQTQSAGVELVGKNKLFTFLDLTTTLNLFYYKLDGFTFDPGNGIGLVTGNPEEDFSWNVRMMANFMLPYAISMQLTGNYNAKQVVAQGYRKANYAIDAGLRKSFFDRKLSVSINARDLLDSRKWHTITSGTGFEQDAKNWRGGRQVGLTLTYSFGNMRAKPNKQSRNNDSGGTMMDADGEY